MITYAPNYTIKHSLKQIKDSPDFADLNDIIGFYYGEANGIIINNGPIILFHHKNIPNRVHVTQYHQLDCGGYITYVLDKNATMHGTTFSLGEQTLLRAFNTVHPLYNIKTKNVYLIKDNLRL